MIKFQLPTGDKMSFLSIYLNGVKQQGRLFEALKLHDAYEVNIVCRWTEIYSSEILHCQVGGWL